MTAAVDDCAGPDWLAGRALLEHHARTGRVFTANEIRGELRELGFGRFSTGRLFLLAHEDGVIRKVGVEVSTDAPTRGAYVRRWIGAQASTPLEALIPSRNEVVVPVRRDNGGRFTATEPAPVGDGPTLLTFMEQS